MALTIKEWHNNVADAPVGRKIYHRLIRDSGILEMTGMVVFDAGCGSAEFIRLAYIENGRNKYVGIDREEESLEFSVNHLEKNNIPVVDPIKDITEFKKVLKESDDEVLFLQMDINKNKQLIGLADVVFLTFPEQIRTSVKKHLKNCCKMLKKGGRLFLTFGLDLSFHGKIDEDKLREIVARNVDVPRLRPTGYLMLNEKDSSKIVRHITEGMTAEPSQREMIAKDSGKGMIAQTFTDELVLANTRIFIVKFEKE